MQDEIRAEGERRKEKLDHFYQDEFRTQIGISQTLSRLSPAASFRYVITELSRTGVTRYQDVKQAYNRFREELSQYADNVNGRRQQGHLPDNWFHQEEVPSLHVAAPRLSDSLSAASPDLLLLGICNVLFFMGTYVFFLRYDAT